jgi:lipopolysaccharide/colanic/teichoic acid biosynthesis glycosyltransferase
MANGLGAVLNAAAELRRRGRRDIRFVFIGDGKEKPGLVERARTEGLDNCVFMDPIPKTALAQFLCRRANLGLMILSDVPAFYYGTSPNKFFDYLASALPVLVNYPGWMADMVKEEQIGMVVPPQDASAFADALVRLADDRMATAQMGQRARAFAQREFRRTVLAERCVAVMERAAAGPACRSSVNEASVSLYRRLGKRVLDLLVVAILLPLVLPVIGVVALLIRFRLGSPVFFQQIRPGYGARPFNLLKFRTMTPECSSDGTLLSDEKRLSKFGSLLRRLSLDELPQLWNVIRGDMSLVGPRPLLMQYLDRYTKEQSRRHEVRPGITGWSQVNGRNAITWEEKFALDVWYVEHVTFWLDIQILFKTIIKTTTSKDISQPGHATAEEFWGTRELK